AYTDLHSFPTRRSSDLKTHDLTWLRQRGHEVVGVEFVETAAVAYFAERGVTPRRFERGGAVCYEHDGVSIWVADFFEVTSEQVRSEEHSLNSSHVKISY